MSRYLKSEQIQRAMTRYKANLLLNLIRLSTALMTDGYPQTQGSSLSILVANSSIEFPTRILEFVIQTFPDF